LVFFTASYPRGPPDSVVFDALAVHDGGAGGGFAANALAVQHQQVRVDLLPGTVVAEAGVRVNPRCSQTAWLMISVGKR
jgi:hypothetical protein